MTKKEKIKAIKQLNKYQSAFWKAESNISTLANLIQPFFKQEIQVCMSTDGAVITDNNGEIGFVINFLNAL